jgi:hypothetical protein
MAIAAPAPYQTSRREHARQRRADIVSIPAHSPTLYEGGQMSNFGDGVELGGAKAVFALSS